MLLKDKCVFVVEDNLQNRIIFTMALRVHGAVVEFERWGRDTIRVLESFRNVDLIILDLMLSHGVSGFDIFAAIRRFPKYDKVPIIAVSAMDPAIAMPKARDMGFAGFIAKPIDSDLFPMQVAKVIAGEQVWYAGDRYQGTFA